MAIGAANRADKSLGNEFDAFRDSGEPIEERFACPVKAIGIEGDRQGKDDQGQCDKKVCEHLV